MPILSLLFAISLSLLLALDYMGLSRTVVLVIDHISILHVVGLFLIVGINICVTELLLFPTCDAKTELMEMAIWDTTKIQ